MRITHVIPTLDPSQGGPSRSVRGLASAQTRFVKQVDVVTGGEPGEYVSKISNLALISAPLRHTRFSVPTSSLRHLLRESISKADIVHLHSIWNGMTTSAARIARRLGKPMILSPRGMLDRHNMRRRALMKRTYLLLERSNLASIKALHYLDESERRGSNWLREIRKSDFLIQPNGLDFQVLQVDPLDPEPTIFTSATSDPSAKHLLFLGRLNRIKGLEMQIDVLAALESKGIRAHLHMIGPDDGEGSNLRKYAASMQMSDRVHQHGPIYSSERLRWLRSADAVLLTSHYECNSVTAAETLAVGGLLVATDTCHLDSAARAEAAIVTPRDATKMAQALAAAFLDESRLKAIRGKALDFSRHHLDWDHLAGQMVQFYHRFLSSSESCAE